MTLFWKTAAAVLLAVVLELALGKRGADFQTVLSVAVCCMAAAVAVSYLEPVLDFLWEMETLGNLKGGMLDILLKAVGIGLVAELAATVCKDAGDASLGKTLEMLGSAAILYMSLPILTEMMTLIQAILGEV